MLIMKDAVAFQVREEILNRINLNIIRPHIIQLSIGNRIYDPAGYKTKFCSKIGFLSPYITRFPSSLFTDPMLREYWSRLVYFSLVSSNVTVLPAEIGQLPALTTLILEDNQLTAIPTEIGQLDKLETLNLRRNRLSAIPAEICELEALKSLCLDINQLEVLPDNLNEEILKTYDDKSYHALSGSATTKEQTLSTQKVQKKPTAKRRRRR